MKTFPIRGGYGSWGKAPGFTVPWDMAEKAYDEYVKQISTPRSLEELAASGGFDWLDFSVLYCKVSRTVKDKHVIGSCTQRVVAELLKRKDEE